MQIKEDLFQGKPFLTIWVTRGEQELEEVKEKIKTLKIQYKDNIGVIYSGDSPNLTETVKNVILNSL